MTPSARIATGVVLVVAGSLVVLVSPPLPPGGARILVVGVALAIFVSGLTMLFFRYSQALVSTGYTLVLVSPLLLIFSILFPTGLAYLAVLPAIAVAGLGVTLILRGRAARKREAAS